MMEPTWESSFPYLAVSATFVGLVVISKKTLKSLFNNTSKNSNFSFSRDYFQGLIRSLFKSKASAVPANPTQYPAGKATVPKIFQNISPDEEYKPPSIPPVSETFKWSETEPIKYRPFKNGTYKMTMAIRNMEPEEWFLMEDTYLKVTNIRREVMKSHPQNTVLHHSVCVPAIREFYEISTKFMCDRYPQYFQKIIRQGKEVIFNNVRDEYLPVDPKDFGEDVDGLLFSLGKSLEEDFLFLLKDDPEGEYVLKGGVMGFPSGFDPAEKLNKPLTEIHGPVPTYDTRLKLSMNKFFSRILPGQFVIRNNWSIQPHVNRFSIGANHSSKDAVLEKLDPKDLNFDEVFLRVERQVLTRLPESKAVVFTIRTYLTPLTKIKAEGRGSDLCGAIDGLPEEIAHYKSAPAWGDAVKAFLRDEI